MKGMLGCTLLAARTDTHIKPLMEATIWGEVKSGYWKGKSRVRPETCLGYFAASKILEEWRFVERWNEQNLGPAMMVFHDLDTVLRRSKDCTGNLARISTNRSSLSCPTSNESPSTATWGIIINLAAAGSCGGKATSSKTSCATSNEGASASCLPRKRPYYKTIFCCWGTGAQANYLCATRLSSRNRR
ncbi:disease resistance protein [Striga asiatica]|uniref:Disease resistance protein n=1 Tax=Striga asiatica TaxID=4170 RepID=A0A5A7QSS6_STRAF|nr:disease resistance protein [Striga asiatica]